MPLCRRGGATHLFLLRQNKISQEKASRSQDRCAIPCAARLKWGQAQTRVRLKQVPALIHLSLRCSALPHGVLERESERERVREGVRVLDSKIAQNRPIL